MIEFRAAASEGLTADAIVVGVGEGRRFDATGAALSEKMPWLSAHLDEAEFTGKVGQVAVVPGGDAVPYRKVALAGLGPAPDVEQVRRAAGGAARSLSKSVTVATSLHRAVPAAAEAVGGGFVLGAYTFTRHKTEKKPSAIATVVLIDGTPDEVVAAAIGGLVGDGVNLARDLINEPAMEKSPAMV